MMNTQTNNNAVEYRFLIEKAIKEPGTISECYSLFHNYSLLNTLHVGYQQMKRFGTITPIRGFRAWNDLNRKIKKGEEALEVLFPKMVTITKDKDGNPLKDKDGKPISKKICVGFMPKKIHFAYSQTEILDKSKAEKEVKLDKLKDFDWKLACKNLGIKIVNYDMTDGNCQGWARPDQMELAINPVCKTPMKTAIHEMAHCLMHGKECKYTREIREVQAETTNYIILTLLGADDTLTSDCRGYIQNWLKDNELDDKICKEIINAANKILEAGTGKKQEG